MKNLLRFTIYDLRFFGLKNYRSRLVAIFNRFDFNYVFIVLVAAFFYLPFLGNVHLFDWDEINFAECAREAIATKNYMRLQIDYAPFWEKPPLYIWLQILSMRLFGVNEYAARFPDAVCGIVSLLSVYHIGKSLRGVRLGLLWAMCLGCSILPFLYFKSGIIDPWFNLFIFLSIVYFIEAEKNVSLWNKKLIIAGIFCGLAILTKGPVGYLLIALTWFFSGIRNQESGIRNQISAKNNQKKDSSFIIHHSSVDLILSSLKRFIFFSIIAVVTALTWFGADILMNGTWFVKTFIEYNLRLAKTEDAGHGGFLGYHFVVILIGCFPMSVFGIGAFFKEKFPFSKLNNFERWMKTLFLVVIILFSLVQSKIVHYSSLCYLPLSFLSASVLYNEKLKTKNEKYFSFFVFSFSLIIGGLLAVVTILLPFVGQHTDILKPFFKKDIFAQANLEAHVNWSGWESLCGIFLIIILWLFLKKGEAEKKNFLNRRTLILFIGTAIFVQSVLIFFVPNIEAYSQRAAIEFYESKSNENCTIETYGFKSYAHLFYAQKKQISDDVKKYHPRYIVGKIQNKQELDKRNDLEFLYSKNGFIFYTFNK